MTAKYELADTDPEVMKVWIELLRKLTPGEKLARTFEMIEFMHSIALSQIRKEHPEYSERDVLREIATRRYGRELALEVYPLATEGHA